SSRQPRSFFHEPAEPVQRASRAKLRSFSCVSAGTFATRLRYRDLEELMRERELQVDHTTIYRWVQRYAPELEKRSRPHLKTTNDSWRVDETSIKSKGTWTYLYRAVVKEGNSLEFLLSPTRDGEAAKRFACESATCHGWFSSPSASSR